MAEPLSNDAAPPLSLSEALLAYRWMALARRLDDAMWALRRQGKGHFAVSCAGHEAVGAALGLALDRTRDVLAPHYRDLAACLAFGLTAREVMAHYFGRAADPCSGGRQPYVHWGSRARRIITLQGPQPNQVTHGVGAAYASKLEGLGAVVWIAFGDGGAQKGEVHEAMNFAGIHKLPAIFCAENNLYTQSVPIADESSVTNLALRAPGYGMPGVSVDGMDVEATLAAAREAVARARAGLGPSFIEARTYRFLPNTSNDDDTRYRTREEVASFRARDPVASFRARVLAVGAATEEELGALEAELVREAEAAAVFGEESPDAAPEEALLHTWADQKVSIRKVGV